MVRPTFYLVGIMGAVVFALRWRGRLRTMVPLAIWFLVGQALVMSPVSYLAWERFGQLRMPRPMWHMMYIGLGGHENPWGIRFDDHCGYEFARAHGLPPSSPDWEARYEALLRDEVLRIRREHPWVWPRNTALNGWDAVTMRFSGAALGADVGPLHARTAFYDSTLPRALLLLAALAWLAPKARRPGPRLPVAGLASPSSESPGPAVPDALGRSWLAAFVVLQSAYFALALGAIIPPYGAYNASFWPGFLLLAGVGLAAMADRARRAWVDPASMAPSRIEAAALLAGAILLCWTRPPSSEHDAWLEATLALLVAVPLARFASAWLGRAGARMAVGAWLLLSLVALLAPAVPPLRLLTANGNACLLVGLGVLFLWREAGLPTGVAALLLVAGTRAHPEAGLAPALLAVLLAPGKADPTQPRPSLVSLAAGCLGMAGVVLAIPGLGVSRDVVVLPLATVILVPRLETGAGASSRARRIVGLVLGLALAGLTFKGLASWRLLALAMLVARACRISGSLRCPGP